MPRNAAIFRESTEPKVLVDNAAQFAASDDSSDHTTLVGVLNSQDFLARLNTSEEYNTQSPKQLRVAKVIRVLRDSQHAVSKQTLTVLAQGGPFIANDWRRQELLVRALVTVRPATPPAVKYWDDQSTPRSVNRHITIEMLCENGTEPALALFEGKLIDPAQETIYKVSWIHAFMLLHRNKRPMLEAAERMITKTLPPELRYTVLETLCDYDARWYPCCYKPRPPSRLLIQEDAKPVLGRICRHAKTNMDLGPRLRLAVETTYREIGAPEEKRT
jgi:hypothetical protein